MSRRDIKGVFEYTSTNNILLSLLFVIVIAAIALLGYLYVPNVATDDGIAPDFQNSLFTELLSFLVTAAVIGPLTAEFVERRKKKEWEPARCTARDRLNDALARSLSEYERFVIEFGPDKDLTAAYLPPLGSDSSLACTVKNLKEFFDIYDDEHASFSPSMHSAASSARRDLRHFYHMLSSIHAFIRNDAGRPDGFKIEIDVEQINKIRALMDMRNINADFHNCPWMTMGSSALADDQTQLFHEPNNMRLIGDIKTYNDIGKLEWEDGFSGVDLPRLRDHWTDFLDSCPPADRPDNPVTDELIRNCDAQTESLVNFLKAIQRQMKFQPKTGSIDQLLVAIMNPEI